MVLQFQPDARIYQLRDEFKASYDDGTIYDENKSISIRVPRHIFNSGFIGTQKQIRMTTKAVINIEAPGCIAARRVELIAKKSISLGVLGQSEEAFPARIYAPNFLLISTKELTIGSLELLVDPKKLQIRCSDLTFISYGDSQISEFVMKIMNCIVGKLPVVHLMNLRH